MNKIVRGNGVLTSALNYNLAAGQTIVKGDLIRITSAGTIKIALATASAAGAVHGIALKNGAASGTTSDETKVAGDLFPVLLFNADTVVAMPLAAGVDINDATVVKGSSYEIVATTNAQTVAATYSAPVCTVVGYPSDDEGFNPEVGDSVDGGDVYVQFLVTVLQGRSA